MRGIVFDSYWQAEQWNRAKSFETSGGKINGNITSKRWQMFPLDQTSIITKEQYADFVGISQQVEGPDGTMIDNPVYADLHEAYTVKKWIVIVNDDLTTYDEQGNATEPEGLVEYVKPEVTVP